MNRDMEITIEVTSNCQAKCPGCIRHKVFNPDTNLISRSNFSSNFFSTIGPGPHSEIKES